VPVPGPEGVATARAAAGRIAERLGVTRIDRDDLARFATDPERTVFVLDVRTPEEHRAGHLPGSRSAPGDRLVRAIDTFIGTFRARIVLVDGPDAVRATITASWLIRLGLDDVYVLGDPLTDTVTGPDEVPVAGVPGEVATTAAPGLAARMRRGHVTVLDIAVAPRAGQEHRWIPDSLVARRSTLVADPRSIPGTGPIVITSADGIIARFTAAELAARTDRDVRVLDGGTASWIEAGLPTRTGTDRPALTPDAELPVPPEPGEGAPGEALVDAIARDGVLSLRPFD
jgi:rhodanese-related sulfurtransferase